MILIEHRNPLAKNANKKPVEVDIFVSKFRFKIPDNYQTSGMPTARIDCTRSYF